MAKSNLQRVVLSVADGALHLTIEGDSARLVDSEGNVWKISQAHVDRLIRDVMTSDSHTLESITSSAIGEGNQ